MTGLRTFFHYLFGSVSWAPPPWWPFHRRAGLFRALGVLLLLVAFSIGYSYYRNRIAPSLIVTQITAPSTMTGVTYAVPQPLSVVFGVGGGDAFESASVAPIDLIDREVAEGITLVPSISGKWRWIGDNTLMFYPEIDWPAGQTYRIIFAKEIFARHAKMARYSHEFSTEPFIVDIEELKFYQDVQDPAIKRIVATLAFNYPVDSDSLAHSISLVQQETKGIQNDAEAMQYPFSVAYDEHGSRAYLSSDPLILSSEASYVNLVVEEGLSSIRGASPTLIRTSRKLLIPDTRSYFQISRVGADIRRNDEDVPEQVLFINTTAGIAGDDLAKNLRVYTLPKRHPLASEQDYRWSSPGEVNADILSLSTQVPVYAMADEHPNPTFHRFKMHVETPGYLYVKIGRGLEGFGGYPLSDDYVNVLPVPRYPQELSFLHGGSLLAAREDRKLTIAARGISEVKFTVSRVLEHNINHLITQTYGNIQDPQFANYSFDADAISEKFSELRWLNTANPSELRYTTLDLDECLKGSDTCNGVFFITAEAWNRDRNERAGNEVHRLLVTTDMDLIVKENADLSRELFVHSITGGVPVEGVQISVLGKNGLPIAKVSTDSDGHVSFPSMKDFKQERAPTVYVARLGSDISFIPFDRSDRSLNYSRFSTEGAVSNSEKALSAFVFTESEIYRPGDTIHIGAIIKGRFASDPPEGLPLQMVVTDPSGKVVMDRSLALPSSHILSMSYEVPSTASTGRYSLDLYTAKGIRKDGLLGYKAVRVEEFLPDRLRMEAHYVSDDGSAVGWMSPADLKAKVSLWNLFGVAAAEHRLTGKVTLTPGRLHFPKYSAYHFVDPMSDSHKAPKSFTEQLGEKKTNKSGTAEFSLPLQHFEGLISDVTFVVEGFEAEGGRCVCTEISTLVAPLDYLVGYKPDSDLSYLQQNSKHYVDLIAINPMLSQINIEPLTIKIISLKRAYTLIKKADGTCCYQSTQQKDVLSENLIDIGVDGGSFSLPTDTIGDFMALLHDGAGQLRSKFHFSVVGASEGSRTKEATLSVKLNQGQHRPGEPVEMQITAPYAGTGLITIERDRVYAYKWFKTDLTTTMQTIEIPNDYQGDGYINVMFVRAWDSDEVFISPMSYAVVPFKTVRDQQTVPVKLDVPTSIHSGDTLTIGYNSEEPSKIVLFAVDEGILQAGSYETPNPLNYFFRKSALNVGTLQIADLILPKYSENSSSTTGGDRRVKMAMHNMNPFKRKSEPPVVFWSGVVDSDVTTQSVTFPVPDYFNGQLRVMAVATSPGKVGSAAASTLVQSEYVIQPTVPLFVAPGDIFMATADITNCEKGDVADGPVIVKLETSSYLEIVGVGEASLVIPPGGHRSASFQVKAKEGLGEAQLTFIVSKGGIQNRIQASVGVRAATVRRSILTAGYDRSARKVVDIPQRFYPEHSTLHVMASTNPLVMVYGLQDYLKEEPNESTGTLIGRAMVRLAIANHPLFPAESGSVDENVLRTLHQVRQRQAVGGGFSEWPGSRHSSVVTTLFVMDYLIELKLAGYSVPSDLFSGTKGFLERYARNDVHSLADARLQAYAIYLLTRSGTVTTSYLTNLQLYLIQNHKSAWRGDIVSAYMAATYSLLKNSREANSLISGYQFGGGGDVVDDSHYLILLARHFPGSEGGTRASRAVTLARRMCDSQPNITAAAYIARALCTYDQSQGPSSDSIAFSEILEDRSERSLDSMTKSSFSPEARQLCLLNFNEEPFFFQVAQSGYPLSHSKEVNGLEVHRDYRDEKGYIAASVERGDVVSATMTARCLDGAATFVTIVDLLPAGFELVPGSIQQSCCDGIEVYEDRLIFHASIGALSEQIKYRLRAVYEGDYVTPVVFAQAQYHPAVWAQGASGRIVVEQGGKSEDRSRKSE